MTFTLHVDGPAWREHTSSVRDAPRSAIRGDTGMSRLGDLVPVAKGNGYGLGLRRLAAEATRLGVDRLAVGTVFEIAEVAEAFHGEILVMSPGIHATPLPLPVGAISTPRLSLPESSAPSRTPRRPNGHR